jgi:hypothetical protein
VACLSIVQNLNDRLLATTIANPIYVTSRDGGEITFEVSWSGALEGLKTIVGQYRQFSIDNDREPFWACLKSLEPCTSTHIGPENLEQKMTYRGVLVIVKGSTTSPAS